MMDMDGLPLYFDAASGTYKIIDDDLDNDSGVDEMPFLSYSSLVSDGSTEKAAKLPVTWDHGEDEADDYGVGLDYLDDERDGDYRPNRPSKACIPKKVKTKVRKNLKFNSMQLSMFSPEKGVELLEDPEDLASTRHYARKDRTPKTIQKMMERHRESERVRHHTLNESMKEVCMRVPGYNPDVKETKVIQMQRLIGYECFLENTVSKICAKLGLKSKMLSSGTNYITESMRHRGPEDWQHYRQVIQEAPCSSLDEDEEASLASQVISTEMCNSEVEPNMTRYKREKISSPTVDSTTDNIVTVYEPGSQLTDTSMDSMWPTQSCMASPPSSLIGFDSSQDSCMHFNSSQESGIKICSQDSSFLNEDFDTLLDEHLVTDPDNLKTITANFMREDRPPACNLIDDMSLGFDLSSPLRPDSSSMLLRSPKSLGIWHHPVGLHYPDKSECPGSQEMTSVSPETLDVVETKPQVRPLKELEKSPDKDTPSYVYDITDNDGSHFNITGENLSFNEEDSVDSKRKMSKVLYVKTRNNDSDMEGYVKYIRTDSADLVDGYVTYTRVEAGNSVGKNKRKRYTPLRARHPFVNLTNTEDLSDVKKPMTKVIKMCRKQEAGTFIADQRVPSTDSGSQCAGQCAGGQYAGGQYTKKAMNMPILRYMSGNPPPDNRVSTGHQGASGHRITTDRHNDTDRRGATDRRSVTDQGGATHHWVTKDQWGATDLPTKPDQRVITEHRPTADHWLCVDRRVAADLDTTPGHQVTPDHHTDQSLATAHRVATDHRVATERGWDASVDHRRTSWMNGFMMFSHVNRQRFIDANPGVHISHIQKMLGHVWRNMQAVEKLPYTEKADSYSLQLGNSSRQVAHVNDNTDSVVPSSTTVDSSCTIFLASNDGKNHYTRDTNQATIIL